MARVRKAGEVFFMKNGIYGPANYFLAHTDVGTVQLISLFDGNRWSPPVEVPDCNKISWRQWRKIAKSGVGEFRRGMKVSRLPSP